MHQDTNLTASATRIDVYPDNHIDPPISHSLVGVVVILWICCLYGCIKGRARALRTAAEADASIANDAPLDVGSRFITGIVEFAEGEESAVEVHIEEYFPEEDNPEDRAGLHWRESSRTTHARPFDVRRGDGQRIQVEPGTDILLVKELDHMISEGENQRTFIARVTAGDKVIVEGALSRRHDPERRDDTYRDNSRGWVMRAQRDRALHISAEPLGQRHRLRAKAFRDAIGGLLVCGLVMHAAFSTYYARVVASQLTTAQITNKDTYGSTDKDTDGSTAHYRVHLSVTWPEAVSFSRELDADDWNPIRSGDTVEFRHVSSWQWASNPGRQSSIHVVSWIFGLIGSLIGSIFLWTALGHRRWYEKKRL